MAEQQVDLRIGNAGGVEVTVNGQKLGTLGAIDEVVDVVFEKVGGEAVMVTPSTTVDRHDPFPRSRPRRSSPQHRRSPRR